MTAFQPSDLSTAAQEWDYYEADTNFQESNIPTVGGLPSQATLSPPAVKAYARRLEARGALRSAVTSATGIPVGSDDLYLISDSGIDGGTDPLVEAENGRPWYRRPWFWPVAVFAVALGAVGSMTDSEK